MILNKTTTPFQNIIKTVITIITNITKYPHPNHHNGNLYPHHHHDHDGDDGELPEEYHLRDGMRLSDNSKLDNRPISG